MPRTGCVGPELDLVIMMYWSYHVTFLYTLSKVQQTKAVECFNQSKSQEIDDKFFN